MPRASLGLGVLFFTCLTVPPLLNAQRGVGKSGRSSSGGELNVQVRYASGQPGPRGIHIRLESAEGGAEGDCQTVEGGKCQFRPASGGVYLVRMNVRGYKEVIVRVELIGTSQGYASLELKPTPGEAPPETPKQESGDAVSVLHLSIPENARQEFEKGQGALKENKLGDGIAHLRKAIKLYDAYPQAYALLGTAYLGQQNWKDAEVALRKANELDPKFPDAYLALGAVFNQTKEYPQAETALLKGLELKPEAAGGHYELAKTYWALGRWQDAAPHARKAVAGMPDLAPAHALLGNVMLRESDAQGALREYQEYLRLDPNGSMAPGVRQMIEKIQKALHP